MEKIINAERIEQLISVFGSFDENIKRIEQTFDVHVTNRGTELKVYGLDEPMALPWHPNCRCCRIPHFADQEAITI